MKEGEKLDHKQINKVDIFWGYTWKNSTVQVAQKVWHVVQAVLIRKHKYNIQEQQMEEY